jgi:alkanesulfonate monooxygenase SsuD/methylene tetrahydromethanopterin reductase-like flavin-dependent oxidoreductase (luciferase family)
VALIAGAVIAPLRHPLLLAKELATLDLMAEGRLVVHPTVSWHRAEYDALGVPFGARGELLDEHLAAWEVLWRDSPAAFAGRHYRFAEVWLEPKPWCPGGPALWFGARGCTSGCSTGSSRAATASTRSAARPRASWSACGPR